MLKEYHEPLQKRSVPPTVDNPLRLTERHFPTPIPQTQAQGTRTQRRCHVCSNTTLKIRKRKDTRYMCKDCKVALCVYPCFQRFHTVKYY